ncbi:SAM-dependent methyltransferase [Pleurocapsa sp. FMAR1]|uniref:SAM-dependent methyltransferase n=1 Tax=Pleurocapsa sp. FMAR1 TaxID=3040204 RepID=UPI0039B0FF97
MIPFQRTIALLAIALSSIATGCASTIGASTKADSIATESQTSASTTAQSPALKEPDVIYVPTPSEVVERMLALANIDQNDVLYDLGSGDGRIPITAIQNYGISRAVGIDIDPQRIQEANTNAKEAGVSDRVRFLNQDLFQSNFSDATVVTLYLLPTLNVQLRPQLLSQLKPGTRIVSHDFDMGEWQPERTEQIEVDGQTHTVYLWTVPEKPPANLVDPNSI